MNTHTPAPTPFRNARRAFTLLEILVVLAIIGLLVGVAVKGVAGALDRSKLSAAKIFVTATLKTALVTYKIDMGSYPSTADGLQSLVAAPANNSNGSWKGPYIEDSAIPKDPWGNDYHYAYPSTHQAASANGSTNYDLWSTGPSGEDGNTDNIGNWMQ